MQGLSAVFLALRRRPVIRYQKSSSAAQRLAEGLYALTYKQQVRHTSKQQQQRRQHFDADDVTALMQLALCMLVLRLGT